MDGDRTITSAQAGFDGSLPHGGPARVGAELRMVREQLGWTLPALSARLKIRMPFLQAIEAGDLAALPAPAYAAGFIRTYADAMELDPDEILRRFRAEGMSRPPKPELAFPDPVPDRAVPPMAVALIVAVIAIGGYAFWYHHSEERLRAADAVPPVPARLAPLGAGSQKTGARNSGSQKTGAQQAALLPSGAQVTSGSKVPPGPTLDHGGGAADGGLADAAAPPSPLPVQTTGASPSTTGMTASKAGNAGGAAAAAPASTAPPSNDAVTANSGAESSTTTNPTAINAATTRTQSAPPASAATPKTQPTGRAPAREAPTGGGLQVRAIAKSWVQVRGPKGKVVFSGILDPGQSWAVPAEPGLVMTTGNAGGTELIRDGNAGAPLGPPGSVKHGVQLTANSNGVTGGAAAGESP